MLLLLEVTRWIVEAIRLWSLPTVMMMSDVELVYPRPGLLVHTTFLSGLHT